MGKNLSDYIIFELPIINSKYEPGFFLNMVTLIVYTVVHVSNNMYFKVHIPLLILDYYFNTLGEHVNCILECVNHNCDKTSKDKFKYNKRIFLRAEFKPTTYRLPHMDRQT